MSLIHPEMALLMLLLPVLIALLVSARRQKQKELEALLSSSLLQRIWQGKNPASRRTGILLSLAFSFLLLALTRPSWGYRFETYETAASEIVLALDVSQSMMSKDVQPSRLEHAKRKISDFVDWASGDRVALVAFAGTAFLQTPLTEDPSAIKMFLDEIDSDLIPVPGSRLELAIERSLSALGGGRVNQEMAEAENAVSPDSQAIVIITDGETSSPEANAAAEQAAAKGIRVYVLGVGTTDGAPIPEKPDQLGDARAFQSQPSASGFKKSSDGQLVISKLNPTLLTQIAQVGKGQYVTSTADDGDLRALYDQGIKRSLGAGAQGVKREKLPVEAFQWPLAIAFVLLAVDSLYSWGMHLSFGLKKQKGIQKILVLFLFFGPMSSLFGGETAFARDLFLSKDRQARRFYDEKNFEAAAKDWKERISQSADQVAPEDYYNLGSALYRAKDYAGAAASFDQAARRYSELQRFEQSADALHNSGNASLLAGKPKEAVESYEKSLGLRPKDDGTQKNLGIARRVLTEQEQKKEQETQQRNDSNNKQDNQGSKEQQDASRNEGDKQNENQGENASQNQTGSQPQDESKDQSQAGTQQNTNQDGNKGNEQDAKESEKGMDSASNPDAHEKQEAAQNQNNGQGQETKAESDQRENTQAESNELSTDELNKAMNRVQERPRMYLQQKALKEAREQVEKHGSPPKGGQDW